MKFKRFVFLLSCIAINNLNAVKVDFANYYQMGRADQDAHAECEYGKGIKYYFGVCDGHGHKGEEVASIAAKHIGNEILTNDQNTSYIDKINQAYESCNKRISKDCRGGTTAVTAVIDNNNLYTANVGDSRAVLSKGGQAIQLSKDHKPNDKVEKERIERLGGLVGNFYGVWRVMTKNDRGGLAVSRAIGDFDYHTYVIPTPTIGLTELTDDCQFLILATDGIWDYVNNQEAVDVVKNSLKNNDFDSKVAAKDLVKYARKKAERKLDPSIDDMTVTLVVFNKDEQMQLHQMNQLYNSCKRLGSYFLFAAVTALYVKKQLF